MSQNTPPQHPAIALTTVRHKDGVSILRVFSREHGIVGCLVREGVKGSRRSRNLYAPLSLLDLVGLKLIKEDLFKFDRAERMLAQDLTTGEVPRGALAMFLAEFILRTLDGGTPHADLFDALWRASHRIEQATTIGRLHLAFLVESVAATGLMPDAPQAAPRVSDGSTSPPPNGSLGLRWVKTTFRWLKRNTS